MGDILVQGNERSKFTFVSNFFIDEYMKDANDAQIKVYLFLVRAFSANMATSVSDMADRFNHTEKDIVRALKYWEKLNLLALDYDDAKSLTGIRILDCFEKASQKSAMQDKVSYAADIVSMKPAAMPHQEEKEKSAVLASSVKLPEKVAYSLDEIKAFQKNEETEQLLFIAEQYIGKPLTSNEIQTIFYIFDKLHFASDLIDYLIQYCVGKDKKDFRYIEKVAISWSEAGISSPKQAKTYARKYDKTVYVIMKALGKTSFPTPKEVSYITKWTKDLSFNMDIIQEACERTVLATDKHRFEYADSILLSWNRSSVHTIDDIKTADQTYQKGRAATKNSAVLNNQFNHFPQRDYDFDALEKEILSN